MADITESDGELVRAVRGGNRKAAGQLVQRYLRSCRALALAVTGDIATAEDACQDAFVYAIERIDDCRDPAKFGAWLRQIVRSHARNHLRYAAVRRTEPLSDSTATGARDSPAAAAELADVRERLLAALSQLSEERREIVLLHDLEGWTHMEIGERLSMPEGTVRSHLHHARRKLRELLGALADRGR